MDTSTNDNFDELPSVETPEDVAVLYSWANLHGAKYRDFSASRREYRAQLRHRAAEQTRDTELRAQADAEAAASVAEQNAREAEHMALNQRATYEETARLEAVREAEKAAQIAAAERMEASRRAEAAAEAAAAARREEREMAEAGASARRQAALYAEAEARRRSSASDNDLAEVPGRISDPYTPESRQPLPEQAPEPVAREYPRRDPAVELHPVRYARMEAPAEPEYQPPPPAPLPPAPAPVFEQAAPAPAPPATPTRRPQGYRPDDASGVRQIYRGPDSSPSIPAAPRQATPAASRPSPAPVPPYATRETTLPQIQATAADQHPDHEEEPAPRSWTLGPAASPSMTAPASRPTIWANASPEPIQRRPSTPPPYAPPAVAPRQPEAPLAHSRPAPDPQRNDQPAAGQLEDPTPKRRRQDLAGYRPTDSDRAIAAYRRDQAQAVPYANASLRPVAAELARGRREEPAAASATPPPPPRGPEPGVPAWIHGQQAAAKAPPARPVAPVPPVPPTPEPPAQQPSVSDTLQRSRERVASRWYALKGVFEQPGQDRPEAQPVRQKETRTPVLAVFSLAGGVGKTSLVATLGRSLSSLGEKVLLTDTTSHGLLPFYFGASELRQGTVRTFSPPSGSTDAPIYMVNYAVDQAPGDDAAQEALVEEIANSGRGAHRILLDLTSSTGWMVRRIARLNPTILVPLAPDMNSVISLQAIEKFFHGANGPDGTPLKVFYVLNQFDASLPLHLDVREVLRRQLGERLLPVVIRRAPAVSEALAEGMTIVDYAADAPVTGDYMNIATWLRSQSAPATAGFRNVRWSER